jgi:hypothetical protein
MALLGGKQFASFIVLAKSVDKSVATVKTTEIATVITNSNAPSQRDIQVVAEAPF